ncbi:lantibiotic dehydratase [Pedobacter sp. GR22-6]|uniref:lantibiotic dehydratase n=1 Tax=Pedobacter sp. GR22-6 TaxID=3127957 RepID=UPI00307F4521
MDARKFSFSPKMVVRTPAMPFTTFNPNGLRNILLNVNFQYALSEASPVLFDALKKCGFEYQSMGDELLTSTFNYYNRMCYRPTPFGAFASVALSEWSRNTNSIILQGQQTKINIPAFSGIEALQDFDQDDVSIYANPSIYEVGGQIRYLFRQVQTDGKPSIFKMMKMRKSVALSKLLKYIKLPKLKNEVIDFLANDLKQENGTAVLNSFFQKQLLYHSCMPSPTGLHYHKLHDTKVKNDSIYSITYHDQQGSLSYGLQKHILDGLSALQKLSPEYHSSELAAFAEKFSAKFESQEIELMRAIDPQVGVSYLGTEKSSSTGEWLKDLGKQKEDPLSAVRWSAVSALLLRKITHAAKEQSAIVHITDAEIANLPDRSKNLNCPPSLSVMFRFAGKELYIEHAGGSSAINLVGRFSHQQYVLDELKKVSEFEQLNNPDVIFAEISALDNAVTDHINSRQHIREYEIPVLVNSNLSEEKVISLDDLLVKVVSGRVVLRSKRLKKEVIPRLASAYNYRLSNLPIFQFLADLQFQDLDCHFSLDPENYLPGLSHYPRISYKNVILSPAKWILTKSELEMLKTGSAGLRSFRAKAQVENVPRFFAITTHDRQLVYDLDNDHSLIFFLNYCRSQVRVVLQEFYFPDKEYAIRNSVGECHLAQFVALLLNNETVYKNSTGFSCRRIRKDNLIHLPPGEWLYFKIYGHEETLNAFLNDPSLQRKLRKHRRHGSITCWFFVRYRDPGNHLRLRIKVNKNSFVDFAGWVSRIIKRFMKQGLVTDYQLATYKPELNRYAMAGMDNVEALFESSSDLISAFNTIRPAINQISFGLLSISLLLTGLFRSFEEGLKFLQNMNNCIVRTKMERLALDRYYREQRGRIVSVMENQEQYLTESLRTKLEDFSSKCIKISICRKTISAGSYTQLAADLIHMHVNRLNFEANPNLENNLYHFLLKLYKGQVARLRTC